MSQQDYAIYGIRSAAILTNSYVEATTLGPNELVEGQNQLEVYVSFTLGSLTSLQIKVEYSANNIDFFQETFYSVSGGTATGTLAEFSYSATGNYKLSIPIKDRYIKISAKGTGTVTSSSLTLNAVIGTV